MTTVMHYLLSVTVDGMSHHGLVAPTPTSTLRRGMSLRWHTQDDRFVGRWGAEEDLYLESIICFTVCGLLVGHEPGYRETIEKYHQPRPTDCVACLAADLPLRDPELCSSSLPEHKLDIELYFFSS